jgi:hypothetical protein
MSIKGKKAAQRRTGGSTGKSVWTGKVKAQKQYARLMARPEMQDMFGDKAIHDQFLRRNTIWPTY